MATAAVNGDRAPDLTEAVVTLQQTIQKFIRDAKTGRESFVLRPSAFVRDETERGYMLSVTSADKEIETHLEALEALEAQLQAFERQLRSRGDWQLPDQLPDPSIATILDIADLSNAITLLGHLINSRELTRQNTSQHTSVYLSRWKLNEIRNVWEHVSMADVNLTPDVAAEMLGAWEDWVRDPK